MMSPFLFLSFLLLINISTSYTFSSTCLGIPGACDLTLQEVTLAGAHNAGAGFDGLLMYHELISLPALSCFYRNQHASIYEQLRYGVRFFDIDLCYEDSSRYERGVWTCHEGAYGGRMTKFLQQVDQWANELENRNEIVVLHFNRDYEKGKETRIGEGIIATLKLLWNPTTENVRNGKLTMQTYLHSRIGRAISDNKRIYVFLHDKLRTSYEPFLFSTYYMGYTWETMSYLGSNGCAHLADKISSKCTAQSNNRMFIRLDLFLTLGLCVDDLSSKCNRYVKSSAQKCFDNSYGGWRGKTVNFLVLDYVHRQPGLDAVAVAKDITAQYIKRKQG